LFPEPPPSTQDLWSRHFYFCAKQYTAAEAAGTSPQMAALRAEHAGTQIPHGNGVDTGLATCAQEIEAEQAVE
jgi:hypothetical protein